MFQTICSRLIQFWAKFFFFLVSVQGAPVSVQGALVSVQGALGQLGAEKNFFFKNVFQTICSRLIQFWAKIFFSLSRCKGPLSRCKGPLSLCKGPLSRCKGPLSRCKGPLDNSAAENFFCSKWFSDFGTVIEMCFRQFAVDWYPFEQNRNFENFENILQVPTTQFLRRKFFFFSKWFSDFGTKIEMCFRQFAVDWYHFEPNQNFENFEIFF